MNLEIIPKQDTVPAYDPSAIQLKHITYYPSRDGEFEEDQIDEALIQSILRQIPRGINVYLSLDPYGEEDWLEVLCDGQWLSLGYYGDMECRSYNPDFAGTEDCTPLLCGGQSPVEKHFALQDLEIGVKAAEYFIRTGTLSPAIPWAKFE